MVGDILKDETESLTEPKSKTYPLGVELEIASQSSHSKWHYAGRISPQWAPPGFSVLCFPLI